MGSFRVRIVTTTEQLMALERQSSEASDAITDKENGNTTAECQTEDFTAMVSDLTKPATDFLNQQFEDFKKQKQSPDGKIGYTAAIRPNVLYLNVFVDDTDSGFFAFLKSQEESMATNKLELGRAFAKSNNIASGNDGFLMN